MRTVFYPRIRNNSFRGVIPSRLTKDIYDTYNVAVFYLIKFGIDYLLFMVDDVGSANFVEFVEGMKEWKIFNMSSSDDEIHVE